MGIPTTVNESVVGLKSRGELVNVECDMLAKYMERLMEYKTIEKASGGVTLEKLTVSGFLHN